MKISKTIDKPDWVLFDATQKLMGAIGGSKSDPEAMFVGGCVRNLLMDQPVKDIDIATKLLPQEIIKECQAVNIKVIPTGIDHGTVTAIIGAHSFEITTLRKDAETDGRHAEVSFTNDWVEDAKRRDFTINTLLMDMLGNIYDPLSVALEDLQNHKIVFVGQATLRIQEDYLRILRFFRFCAWYGEGEADEPALKACALHADKISELSRERITSEFLKILEADKAAEILDLMFYHKVLVDLKVKGFEPEVLQRLIYFQKKYSTPNVMARLLVLSGVKARFFDDYLRLSHAQKNFLVKLDMAANNNFYGDEKELKKAIYYHGSELMMQGYLIYSANKNIDVGQGKLEILNKWIPPVCPITGGSLIQEGYVTGPDLGLELKRRQEEWLEDILGN